MPDLQMRYHILLAKGYAVILSCCFSFCMHTGNFFKSLLLVECDRLYAHVQKFLGKCLVPEYLMQSFRKSKSNDETEHALWFAGQLLRVSGLCVVPCCWPTSFWAPPTPPLCSLWWASSAASCTGAALCAGFVQLHSQLCVCSLVLTSFLFSYLCSFM